MKANNNKSVLFVLIAFFSSLSVVGQVITTTPVYPLATDSCTVIFDAAQGNAGLKDVTTPIYAHTGVITNLSTSGSDWKYVVAGWNENTAKAQLTSLGNNKFKLVLKPTIRAYYGVPEQETIEKLAFVFRNGDGSKTGRNADGSDIFADVYPSVLSININQPDSKSLYVKLNDPIPVYAISPMAVTLQLLVNGTVIKTETGQTISETLTANHFGQFWAKQWVKVVATGTSASVADSFSYTVIPDPEVASLPAGIMEGINYTSASSATLCLFAPGKSTAFATGDFNNWQLDEDHYMKITPDGNHFWVEINNLTPKEEYIFQYVVDGQIRIGDPYADKVSDPNDQYIPATTYPNLKPYPTGKAQGIATYLQPGQDPYVWNILPYTPPAVTDLVIYELLIRDFTAAHDYPSLIDTLDYLKKLGVNAIELMPVMEFEGNLSWGYNPNYSFAVDKYYGTKNGLKQFVEACHAKGIAVILDIVCNHHFGSSPMAMLYWDATNQRPSADNPWFNVIPKHPYNVGNDFNHDSPATARYMDRLIRYWLTEFKVDGYRFDLSKGFTQKNSYPDNVSLWGQYDATRIDILKKYTNIIHEVNPNGYAIMEHFADNTEESVLAANKMLLWGNLNYKYIQAGGGWVTGSNSDLSWGSYKQRGWMQPNLVTYMESHDEERVMFKNISAGNNSKPPYAVKDTTTALKRVELNANFFYTIPGPKMLWQFEELGYDYSIESNGGRLAPKPIRWDYQDQWRRRYTYNVFSALAELKTTQPVFSTNTYSIDLTGPMKRIWLRHSSMDAVILGNFDVISQNITPDFTTQGMWYEFYTGDSVNVLNISETLSFKPGEYRIYTTKKLNKPIFTGLAEQDLLELTGGNRLFIYPNPSEGNFSVSMDIQNHSGFVEFELYSLAGVLIGKTIKKAQNNGVNTISLRSADFLLPEIKDGIYVIRMISGTSTLTGKLIIRR